MFNKYWREYPIWLQMLLLILMIFTMVSASLILSYILPPMITGVPVTEILALSADSSAKTVDAFKLLQLINNLTMFGGTAFLYAYASHPEPGRYLGFRKIRNPFLVVIALVLALGAMPMVLQLGQWMFELNFNAAATEAHERTAMIMSKMMENKSFGGLLFTLLVLAVTPAFAEELFFRGIAMRFFHKQTKNLSFAVFMSAGLFALFHFQVYNLLSIFIMGMILGYVYYYTGSIWVSIIVHFMNNALQIVVTHLANIGVIPASVAEEDNFAWYILVVASGVAVLFFMLLKKQATPLPQDWSSDFTVDEPEQKFEDLNNRH